MILHAFTGRQSSPLQWAGPALRSEGPGCLRKEKSRRGWRDGPFAHQTVPLWKRPSSAHAPHWLVSEWLESPGGCLREGLGHVRLGVESAAGIRFYLIGNNSVIIVIIFKLINWFFQIKNTIKADCSAEKALLGSGVFSLTGNFLVNMQADAYIKLRLQKWNVSCTFYPQRTHSM